MSEEVKKEHPQEAFILIENELLKFASYDNVRKVLSSYGVYGKGIEDDQLERILVVLTTEFRHVLEKYRGKLPEDSVEAIAKVEKSAGRTRKVKAPKKPKAKAEATVVEVLDSGDEIVEVE